MHRGAILSIVVASTLTTASAGANGRFPQAQAIVTPNGDPSTLFLRATFGLLVSRDGGKSFRFVCERALGYDGQWDPPIAATGDGRLWVGREDGLVSTKDGCEVTEHAELRGETIKDLTTDPKGVLVWAITGAPGKKSNVFLRKRGAQTFERTASMDEINFMTIEVAPTRPSRVYISGQPYGTIRGRLYVSDDRGATFEGRENDLPHDGPFFIAAVDVEDPNRVLVRHLHAEGSELLLTTDAGKTWKNVLSMKSAMFGFTISPDLKTYWAASGLAEHGIYRSTDRGATFESVGRHGVLCLHAVSSDKLFVCENPFALGAPAIGLSDNAGRTVNAIAKFNDIAGPVTCPSADAAASVCASSWTEARASFTPRPAADAGAPKATATPSSTPSSQPRGACGCDVPGASALDPRGLTAGLFTLIAWCVARSRRGSNGYHRRCRETSNAAPHRD